MKLEEYTDPVLFWAFVLMCTLILGMYIGATQQEHHTLQRIKEAVKKEADRCEVRITNVLLQLEINFNGLEFSTADGITPIYPRRVKVKVEEGNGDTH